MFENEHTHSARKFTMFAHAQLLRNWREQRPSNQGDLDSSATVKVSRVYYTGGGGTCFGFHFCTVVRDCG
jgi:hypothetical protein